MNTDVLTIEQDAELFRKRRPWYLLAAALFVLSLLVQQPLVFLAALFTTIIAWIPELWYRLALRHLVVQQKVSQQHIFFGEDVTLAVSIENHKFLPLPWLQVENKITPPLVKSRHEGRSWQLQKTDQDTLLSTWLLWSFQRVTRRYRIRCTERGFHAFGPLRLHSSDPFGWLETDVRVPTSASIVVYPLLVPMHVFGFHSAHPLGESATDRPLLEDPLRIAGVRDYVMGDDPRRIHWKATARMGVLQSKIYEASSLQRFLVLLDTWNYAHDLNSVDREVQELTITVAASFATWALDEGYMVGLFSNSSLLYAPEEEESEHEAAEEANQLHTASTTRISPPGVHIPFASDHSQYERILTTLARLLPDHNTPLERLIDQQRDLFPLGTTVVLVSAASSVNDATLELLEDVRARGAAVHLVLTGEPDAVKKQTELYRLPVHYPGGREKWHELINAVGKDESGIQLD
ncbi:MAG TPA: DUF58 domain-containing protein [Ktedonobacteraceae bacterium]|jgi:uncharacterized protein (DUF58 family)|nr:DUF58 domain-containing protein [Ktedonobacteraceae bacterium]